MDTRKAVLARKDSIRSWPSSFGLNHRSDLAKRRGPLSRTKSAPPEYFLASRIHALDDGALSSEQRPQRLYADVLLARHRPPSGPQLSPARFEAGSHDKERKNQIQRAQVP